MPRETRRAELVSQSLSGDSDLLKLLSAQVRSCSRLSRFNAGAVVVREGEAGSQAYILLSGLCEVTVHGEVVNQVMPGELFGEIACLASGPRTATVRALRDSEVLELSVESLRSELRRSPAFLDRFLRDLAHRVRMISERETAAKDEHRHLRMVLERLQPSLQRFANHPSLSVEVRSEPLTFASGDYYDVLEMSPERFLFALGDVMGHGAPTTPILAMVRGQLHECATSDSRPHDLLGHLHRHMRQHGHPNVFMTMTLMMLDVRSMTAELAVAGPPCPLLLRDGICGPLTTEFGWTLGYPFEGVTYKCEQIALTHGDVVLFYTDGLTDVAADGYPDGDRLGTGGLAKVLCDVVSKGETGIPGKVFDALNSYRGGSPLEDDATAFVVRVR
jgi:serine phosphatase RsbU (regulator of sigma subunit)